MISVAWFKNMIACSISFPLNWDPVCSDFCGQTEPGIRAHLLDPDAKCAPYSVALVLPSQWTQTSALTLQMLCIVLPSFCHQGQAGERGGGGDNPASPVADMTGPSSAELGQFCCKGCQASSKFIIGGFQVLKCITSPTAED